MASSSSDVVSANEATTTATRNQNPYHDWKCAFDFTGHVDLVKDIPYSKVDFLEAVKGDITNITFIQNGLISYIEAVHSGVYHTFSSEFLQHQNDATHKTIGQLFHISRNLQAVVQAVESNDSDLTEVKAELRDAYAYALPWIQRTRAILVSAHVFYKINYVLGSDRTKH